MLVKELIDRLNEFVKANKENQYLPVFWFDQDTCKLVGSKIKDFAETKQFVSDTDLSPICILNLPPGQKLSQYTEISDSGVYSYGMLLDIGNKLAKRVSDLAIYYFWNENAKKNDCQGSRIASTGYVLCELDHIIDDYIDNNLASSALTDEQLGIIERRAKCKIRGMMKSELTDNSLYSLPEPKLNHGEVKTNDGKSTICTAERTDSGEPQE